MTSKKKVIPNWYKEPTPPGTWRSLFKWGDPARLMMDTFGLTEQELQHPRNLGLEKVDGEAPVTLQLRHIQAFHAICGEENVSSDLYYRLKCSYGYGMIWSSRRAQAKRSSRSSRIAINTPSPSIFTGRVPRSHVAKKQ